VLVLLYTSIPTLYTFTTSRIKPCSSDQSCVPFPNCRYWCDMAQSGQFVRNITLRSELKRSTCQFEGAMPYVCCENNENTKVKHCSIDDKQENIEVETKSTRKPECGRIQDVQDLRCVGCNSTSPGAWPWMARLLYKENIEQSSKVTLCGGVLVSSRHVITAAHCVKRNQQPHMVVLGESDITTEFDCLDVEAGCGTVGSQCFRSGMCAPKHIEIPVRSVMKHPQYKQCDGCVPRYDVAVILLDDLVSFSNYIQPLCLPSSDGDSPEGAPLIMTGWGNVKGGFSEFTPASILQELVVNEVPLSKCGDIWNTKLLPNQLCVSSGTAGQAPCQGDSGGPVVRLLDRKKEVWELAGVVSFGPSVCGNVDHPVGLSRISGDMLDWVRGVVEGVN